MRRALERFGWGAGPQDDAPPIDAAGAERTRALAFWLILQVGSQRALNLAVQAVFQRPSAGLGGAEGTMARLFSLLQRLIASELPALARAIRIETTHTALWMREPRGGRVDAGASLGAGGGASPANWLVHRIERRIETPVNQFATAILRTAAARIDEVGAMYRRRGLHLPDVVAAASVSLQRFLRDHPLGGVELPGGASPEQYRRAAALRAAEFRRIHTLAQWWDAIQDIELATLRELFSEDGKAFAELSVHGAHEMAVALGLVCAPPVSRRFESSEAGYLRFVDRAGAVDICLGPPDPLGIAGRGFTASMTLTRSDASRETTLIDARNCRMSEIRYYAINLAHTCSHAGCTGLLLTPGPVGTLHSSLSQRVRWVEMPAIPDVPALMQRWLDILASNPV